MRASDGASLEVPMQVDGYLLVEFSGDRTYVSLGHATSDPEAITRNLMATCRWIHVVHDIPGELTRVVGADVEAAVAAENLGHDG